MKIGDSFPVTLAGHVVAQARVVGMDNGTATLRFTGAEVVMAVRTELAPETPKEPESQTIITGVDREVSAPVGEPTPSQPVLETPVDNEVKEESTEDGVSEDTAPVETAPVEPNQTND